MPGPPRQLTGLLLDWSRGDEAAFQKLMPMVYREMRKLARRYLRDEHLAGTMQTTGLVHEAYCKMVDQDHVQWQGRAHFFRAAAVAMRRILVDHARARAAEKRDFGQQVTLTEASGLREREPGESDQNIDVVALDKALATLAQLDERKASIVELRYFAGLSVEMTGEVLGISPGTVKREWGLARLWLFNQLNEKASDPQS
jgi:RNA polymerase sigma factor (TIGR02999 family)